MTRRDRYVEMLVERILGIPRPNYTSVEAQCRLVVNTIIADAEDYQRFHRMPYPFKAWCDAEEDEGDCGLGGGS